MADNKTARLSNFSVNDYSADYLVYSILELATIDTKRCNRLAYRLFILFRCSVICDVSYDEGYVMFRRGYKEKLKMLQPMGMDATAENVALLNSVSNKNLRRKK